MNYELSEVQDERAGDCLPLSRDSRTWESETMSKVIFPSSLRVL